MIDRKFHQTFKEKVICIHFLQTIPKKIEEDKKLPNSFNSMSITLISKEIKGTKTKKINKKTKNKNTSISLMKLDAKIFDNTLANKI